MLSLCYWRNHSQSKTTQPRKQSIATQLTQLMQISCRSWQPYCAAFKSSMQMNLEHFRLIWPWMQVALGIYYLAMEDTGQHFFWLCKWMFCKQSFDKNYIVHKACQCTESSACLSAIFSFIIYVPEGSLF